MSYIRYDAFMSAENSASHDSPPPQTDTGVAVSTPNTPSFSPLYQQIKLLILQSLQSGEWKPSAAIPSEMELAARFKVSQGTVRKAIDELSADNLLIRRQGKGTFVATHAERQVQYRFLRLYPNNGDLASDGPAQRQIVECITGLADEKTAQALGLSVGDAVLQLKRVLSFAGIPTILEDIWLPGLPFEGLTAARLEQYDGPMYALFETEFDVKMVRAEEKIRAVLPDKEQSDLLQISPQTPVLSVERTAYTYNDVPMELRRGLYLTDTHYYRNLLN